MSFVPKIRTSVAAAQLTSKYAANSSLKHARLLTSFYKKPFKSNTVRSFSTTINIKMASKEELYSGDTQYVKKTQEYPGHHESMHPDPKITTLPDGQYKPADKLKGKRAIITGGDSGIGKSVAVLFALEGATTVFTYMKGNKDEQHDAEVTKKQVDESGGSTECYALDAADVNSCKDFVKFAADKMGGIDIVVNNCGYQNPIENLVDLSDDQWDHTFKVNIYSYFWVTKAALPYLKEGSTIINDASVNAYKGNAKLVDYTATKGAIIGFTRSIALQLASKGIRCNAVAPGPIATPLVASTFSKEHIDNQPQGVPLGRGGQPAETATSFVFLASSDSAYMSGQTLHPNGGTVING